MYLENVLMGFRVSSVSAVVRVGPGEMGACGSDGDLSTGPELRKSVPIIPMPMKHADETIKRS